MLDLCRMPGKRIQDLGPDLGDVHYRMTHTLYDQQCGLGYRTRHINGNLRRYERILAPVNDQGWDHQGI